MERSVSVWSVLEIVSDWPDSLEFHTHSSPSLDALLHPRKFPLILGVEHPETKGSFRRHGTFPIVVYCVLRQQAGTLLKRRNSARDHFCQSDPLRASKQYARTAISGNNGFLLS